jgi:hypothetical protein
MTKIAESGSESESETESGSGSISKKAWIESGSTPECYGSAFRNTDLIHRLLGLNTVGFQRMFGKSLI